MNYLIDTQINCSINEQELVDEMIILFQQHPIVYNYIIHGLKKNHVRKTLGISIGTINILNKGVRTCITDISSYKRSALIKTIFDLINEDLE